MDTVTMRTHIQSARRHEDRTHELARLLHARLARLHSAICVRSAEPHIHLLSFVTAFVDRTPELLDILQETTRNTPREELGELIGDACMNFFTAPPPLIKGRNGMNGAMAKSYLCHRIIEEINDCHRVFCRQPLLPVDFTSANLIIHQLIGEPLANLLDNLVDVVASRLYDLCDFSHLAGCNGTGIDEWLAVCRRHALMDDNLSQGVVISNIFPGCTIH